MWKLLNLVLHIFGKKKKISRGKNEHSLVLFVDNEGNLIQEVFTKKGDNYLISYKRINSVSDPYESWRSFEFR